MTYRNSLYARTGHDEPVNYRSMCWERLAWAYGAAKADLILSGRDPATQADLAAWRGLGGSRP